MLLASPWVAKLNERRGPRFAVRLGAAISVTCVTGMALSVERFEFVVLTGTVLCAGICLVYSALPMLLVSAVPSGRTAQAMGVNQLMRAVGSSLGVQAAAAVVSSSIGADGAIHASGYRDAFIILALACAGAFVLACALAATPVADRVRTA